MDINKIREFHSYDPFFDDDTRLLLDWILSKYPYLPEEHYEGIIQAYEFARDAHSEERRLSGELYIVHPIKVLEFLLLIKPDLASIQATLLHDVIEDTPITHEQIEKTFWSEVAELCEWLVKVSKVRFRWETRQLETLKKMFLAMWKDLRVIFIKLADRIHNIQTLHFHPKKEKRNRIAEETLKVYVPIAKRLWLYVFQWYLENGAFKNLDPKEYKRIYQYVTKKYGDVDAYKKSWIDRLMYLCEEEGVTYLDITWRLKSPYRIHKKLKKYQTSDIWKVMDVLAFRMLTDTVWNCYNMLGIIHKHYTPIFAKMKDYIALPKPNWYKSLHTTILWMFDFPVEIQVRTEEMDQVAEYWVAAHFAYAEKWWSSMISDKQAAWLQRTQDLVQQFQQAEDKDWFKQHLNVEILENNIFVYTPKWDIIELPEWSSVLDFAFRVHTDIWLKFKNWFVNGKIVPLDYTLQTWDIIDVHTFKNKITATRWREKYLHTPTAKSKLTRHIRQQEKSVMLVSVKDAINQRLREFWLPLLWTKGDELTRHFSQEDREKHLWQVYDKQITTTKLVKIAYKDVVMKKENEMLAKKKISSTIATLKDDVLVSSTIIIDHDKELHTDLCKLCFPHAWDKIIAKSDKWMMKIHKVSCDALQEVKSNKFYEAHRKWADPASYALRLHFVADGKPGVLLKVLRIFESYRANVWNIVTNTRPDGRWNIQLDVRLTSLSKIDFIMGELESKSFIELGSKQII